MAGRAMLAIRACCSTLFAVALLSFVLIQNRKLIRAVEFIGFPESSIT